jgi:hypothetical protein
LTIGSVTWVIAATGVPSYLFHPRRLSTEQQNRAIALSYYVCGILSWLAVACGLLIVYATWQWPRPIKLSVVSAVYACLCAAGVLVMFYWWRLAWLAGRVTQSPGYGWLVFLLLPVLWALVTVLTLGLVTGLVFYVAVIFLNWP